jgi:hypothetical protein
MGGESKGSSMTGWEDRAKEARGQDGRIEQRKLEDRMGG